MTKSPKGVPTKQQVIAELRDMIRIRKLFWGKPLDSELYQIRCLEMALCIVKEWKAPRK